MTKILWAVVLTGSVSLVWGIIKSNQVHTDRISTIAQEMNVSLDTARVIDQWNEMQFFHDLTTGLCFASLWKGAGNGGPMMAYVPCAGLSAVSFESGDIN